MGHYKNDRLESRINVLVNDKTDAYLRARAEKEGISISLYVRSLIEKDEQANRAEQSARGDITK